MIFKLIGAAFIIASCGGFGLIIAINHKKEVRLLKALVDTISFMKCDLQYKYTPLPSLCRLAATFADGPICKYFEVLSEELNAQICPDTRSCCLNALSRIKDMPDSVNSILLTLSDTLGAFDLNGQLSGMDQAIDHANQLLDKLTFNQDQRLRSYQTLALCAGAALAILLV